MEEGRVAEISADFWYLRKKKNRVVMEPEDEDEEGDPRDPTKEEEEAETRAAGVEASEEELG